MLCHDYMAFSCACQSLLIFNRFFRPIFVLGSLKGKINLIQTIVTSILTRRLEKAFLVFMKRNGNRLQSKGRSHPRCFFLTTVSVVRCARRKLLFEVNFTMFLSLQTLLLSWCRTQLLNVSVSVFIII